MTVDSVLPAIDEVENHLWRRETVTVIIHSWDLKHNDYSLNAQEHVAKALNSAALDIDYELFVIPGILCTIIGAAPVACSTVNAKAAACLGFATGKAATPSAPCCSGLSQLAATAKTVDDKKNICRCLKTASKSLGIQDKFLSKIPQACGIKVGFPVSTTTNCETIH
ncbi:hypothetical protein ACFE04_000843 [Oxalis oulophora]